MREILFRGLRTDGKGWEFGYLVEHHNITGIIPIDEIRYSDDGSALDFFYVEVIPETVGQFTGVIDKKGNKIFEGDEVFYKSNIKYNPIDGQGNVYKGIIEWWDGQTGIGWRYRSHRFTMMLIRGNVLSMEVIGNIHEK